MRGIEQVLKEETGAQQISQEMIVHVEKYVGIKYISELFDVGRQHTIPINLRTEWRALCKMRVLRSK